MLDEKARRSTAVFSRKKTRKKKMISSNPSYQSMDCVIKWGIRFITILLEIFSFVSKCLSATPTEKKTAEMG